MVSRREFLAATGAAVLMPQFSFSADAVPAALDHILLGCSDLNAGIAWLEQRTGVRAQFGGVHPGRGTQNALASLGQLHYLEIIAPDPKQTDVQQWAAPRANSLKSLRTPRLIGWAAHVDDIEALAKKLRAAGIATGEISPGSRKRPGSPGRASVARPGVVDTGQVLHWKTLALQDDHHGLLPFFIQWSADSQHPSLDAPAGCRLEHFALADPNPAELSASVQRLGLDVPVERANAPQLRARLAGPKGVLDVASGVLDA